MVTLVGEIDSLLPPEILVLASVADFGGMVAVLAINRELVLGLPVVALVLALARDDIVEVRASDLALARRVTGIVADTLRRCEWFAWAIGPVLSAQIQWRFRTRRVLLEL